MKKLRILLILIIFTFLLVLSGTYLISQVSPGEELNFNIVDEGFDSALISPAFLVFSREDLFIDYYANMKKLPAISDINPGIHFDYNMAVVLAYGERYVDGYSITLEKVKYNGSTVHIFYRETQPDPTKEKKKRLTHPYCIASVYYDKEIREHAKVISFINVETGELRTSAPIVKIKRNPYYEIPESVRVVQVEKGDYGNFTEEKYLAFNNHFPFNSAYMQLRENDKYLVRPPELSFLGNIVVLVSLGQQENGGYEILANGAYTNVYVLGNSLYVMVRKVKPTEETIRYYDITTPYSIASIQVGMRYRYLKYVYFLDETTGKTLGKVKLPRVY